MIFTDYYAVLKTHSSATPDEIKTAYRILARQFHPDVNRGKNTTAKMQDLNEAYMILRNTETRQRYDQEFQHYSAWSAEQRTTTQEQAEYSFFDENLAADIREASRTAREMKEQFIEETKELLIVAGKETISSTLIYGFGGIVLFLLALAQVQCSR